MSYEKENAFSVLVRNTECTGMYEMFFLWIQLHPVTEIEYVVYKHDPEYLEFVTLSEYQV